MVMAGEGVGCGVGGKATRNQFRGRSRTTPYDQRLTARRNASLLSKLVLDPIRNLASSAAQRYFAYVTGKRLTPSPPLPSESIQEVTDGLEDAVIKNKAEAPEPLTVDGQNLAIANAGGISELQQLLKQTRSEIDRLTELLQSKAVDDLPVDCDVKWVEASLSDPAANFEKPQQIQTSPLAENGTRRERSHGVISTPGISARVLEEDVASTAELAKAYMGSRLSKVSPSMLGLRSQVIREEAAVLSNTPFTPKFPIMSLGPRVTSHLELGGNSFAIARSRGRGRGRGRTAIYRMARAPYPRVPRTAFCQGSEPRRYGNEGYSLPSSSLQDQDGKAASTEMALKRSSSALDDDLGSVGLIRRIRQKHNLSSQGLNLPATRGIGGSSGVLKQPLSLTQNLPLTDQWKNKGLKMVQDNEYNGAPITRYSHVPPKSSETAARILQQLEKATPKEKSVESKLVTARAKSPAKLTTDMLHGRALRSLEDANSPKFLQSTQGSQRLEDLSQSSLTRVHAFDFREPGKIEENGPKTCVRCETSTPIGNQNSTALGKDEVTSADGSDPVVKLAAQKKRAFTDASDPVAKLAARKKRAFTDGSDPVAQLASQKKGASSMHEVALVSLYLFGRALTNLEDSNSPKLLQSTQGSQRLEDLSQSSSTRVHAIDFREPERIEENGPKTSVQCETSTPVVNHNSAALGKDVVTSADGSDPAAKLAAQHLQKKPAFIMSVHEDTVDLDEDTYSNWPTSEAVVGGGGKSEKSLTTHSSASAEKVVEDETAVLPEMKKSPPEPIFGEKIGFEVCNAAVVAGEKNDVTFPALQASGYTEWHPAFHLR